MTVPISGFAFEAKQLFAADPIRVIGRLTFFDANGAVLPAPNGNVAHSFIDADAWQRASGTFVAPAGAAYVQLSFTSYRTDGNLTGRMDFAVRKLQLHKLHDGEAAVPAWTAPKPYDNDRVTDFTYDKMGRRLTETRRDVLVHDTGDSSQHPGEHRTQNAKVVYEYNGAGEVTKKTEATGEQTIYQYDLGGRLEHELRPGFLDFNSQAVTPTTDYYYTGLNDLARVRQRGIEMAAPLADTPERVTKYAYGEGGRLLSMAQLVTDETTPETFTRTYRYDKAGRVVRDEYQRKLPDGTLADEAVGYDYDGEGRIVAQGLMVKQGGAYTRSVTGPTGGQTIDTAVMTYKTPARP